MFTTGQMVFAIIFLIAFIIAAIFVYRKGKKLHSQHYKGSYRVLIGFLLFIAFLFVMKTYLKH